MNRVPKFVLKTILLQLLSLAWLCRSFQNQNPLGVTPVAKRNSFVLSQFVVGGGSATETPRASTSYYYSDSPYSRRDTYATNDVNDPYGNRNAYGTNWNSPYSRRDTYATNDVNDPFGNRNAYGTNSNSPYSRRDTYATTDVNDPYGNRNAYGTNSNSPYGRRDTYATTDVNDPYGNRNAYGTNSNSPYGRGNSYNSDWNSGYDRRNYDNTYGDELSSPYSRRNSYDIRDNYGSSYGSNNYNDNYYGSYNNRRSNYDDNYRNSYSKRGSNYNDNRYNRDGYGNRMSNTRRSSLNEWRPDMSRPDVERQLIQLTEQLLDATVSNDWNTYASLCDRGLTCFDPEALGQRVDGLEFQKYYFDLYRGDRNRDKKATLLQPKVRLTGETSAVVSYVRMVQAIDRVARTPVTIKAEETKVWQVVDGRWLNVHSHCSTVKA